MKKSFSESILKKIITGMGISALLVGSSGCFETYVVSPRTPSTRYPTRYYGGTYFGGYYGGGYYRPRTPRGFYQTFPSYSVLGSASRSSGASSRGLLSPSKQTRRFTSPRISPQPRQSSPKSQPTQRTSPRRSGARIVK